MNENEQESINIGLYELGVHKSLSSVKVVLFWLIRISTFEAANTGDNEHLLI